MNTSPPPPLLALPVPVYRKRAKSKRKKMKRKETAIDADPPTSHAGTRNPRPEPLFSRYWNTSVHSIERAAAKRKMKRVRVLSGEDFDSICKVRIRRRGSELSPFLGKGSKRKRETVSVLSPICSSCITRGRSELLFSRKGGDSMEWAADKIRVRSKRKTRTVTEAVPICNISVRRRRSELPRLRKRVWGVDWMVMAVAEMEGEEEDPARSICASHKVKKAFATPPAVLGFAEALGISQQMHAINMTVENNIITGRAKKKAKKYNEMVKMMTGEENTKEEENPSCSNGGISRQSLESFADMVKAFRYAGNRGGIESDVASASANVAFSTTFRGEKASCNGTRATNVTLEETENNNIPETTPLIATTSFTTLNHNKRITGFENSNAVVAVNPSLVSGQQDEAPWVLPASVSKKMRRKHKEAAVHAPCPALAHEPASQKTKKQRKMASSPTTDEVGKVRKSVRCKHREAMTKAEKMQDSYRRVSPDNNWVPPNSPYELLQEDHAFDPWRVLVICMLLNQTTGEQVKKILRRVFLLCPTAEAAIQVPMNELRTIIESLGLQNKRVRDIREMSRQYLKDGWTYVTELHGIGKYAADAYAIFCVGKPEDIVPDDHMLVKYWEYVVLWKREQYCLAVG